MSENKIGSAFNIVKYIPDNIIDMSFNLSALYAICVLLNNDIESAIEAIKNKEGYVNSDLVNWKDYIVELFEKYKGFEEHIGKIDKAMGILGWN